VYYTVSDKTIRTLLKKTQPVVFCGSVIHGLGVHISKLGIVNEKTARVNILVQSPKKLSCDVFTSVTLVLRHRVFMLFMFQVSWFLSVLNPKNTTNIFHV